MRVTVNGHTYTVTTEAELLALIARQTKAAA
jgi:hypothetical protein